MLKFRELNIHEENEHEIPKVLDLPLLPIGASPKDLAIRRALRTGRDPERERWEEEVWVVEGLEGQRVAKGKAK